MNKCLPALLVLTAMPFALYASGGDTPPSTHLQKGEWAYHSVIKFTSGLMSGRTVTKDWKVCNKNDKSAVKSLMPRNNKGNTTCSKPTLAHDSKSYHTTMTCTTVAKSMTSKIKQDFVLTAGDKGTTFKAHGTVQQQLTVRSMAPRSMNMTADITGKRVGECKAD